MSSTPEPELVPDTYLTIRAAARRVQIDEAFLRDLIRRGEGPAVARVKNGNLILVRAARLGEAVADPHGPRNSDARSARGRAPLDDRRAEITHSAPPSRRASFRRKLKMRVFIHGSENRPPVPLHVMTVNPANHGQGKQEVPAAWVDENNRGRDFTIEFVHGEATVDPQLGKYLIDAGLAHRTRRDR